MRIVHVTDALSAYIDGELAGDERAHVERHLETCEDCRRSLAGLRTVVTLVRASEPISAPEGFQAQVRAQLERMGAGQAARRWPVIPLSWRLIGAAAAVAIIGIFAVSLLRTEGPVAMREATPSNESPAISRDRVQSGENRSAPAPPEGMKSAADQRSAEAPTAPGFAQRPTPAQRSLTVQRLIVIALPAMTLGALAWMVVRRRRRQRAW